ncbi:DNA primase, partial [Halopenitus persicus]
MTDADDGALEELAEYLRLNPEATTPEVLGATDTDPAVWGDAVDDALASDDPHLALETPDTGAPEGDSRDANPTLEADKPASTTSETPDTDGSALVDALEWFHQQLDRDLPDECDHDTPRDYYRDGRGWDADTIDEKLLGFAPANYKDDLIAHLFGRGHDRDAIRATGLFTEDLRPLWRGRYVLPYFDADGRAVYAIARETAPKHPEDFLAGKYGKLAHTKDYVTSEEPIYGLDTVEPGDPVLITEGIADAITAHEAGYPCISPVTKQFKQKHHDVLLEALDERDVDRVYLIQDAERPTSNVDDRDRLTLQQFGEGVKGAVKTAAYLDEHGLEARVAELPRPGLEKVDLDDYLQGWSDDLTPLLAGAKPVDQHPAYDADTAKDVALEG